MDPSGCETVRGRRYGSLVNQTPTEMTAGAVRAELARRRISGQRIARELNWSPSTTRRRLIGQYPFTVEELGALAAHLGVPIGTFVPAEDAAA